MARLNAVRYDRARLAGATLGIRPPGAPVISQEDYADGAFLIAAAPYTGQVAQAAVHWRVYDRLGVLVTDLGVETTNLTLRSFGADEGIVSGDEYRIGCAQQDALGQWGAEGLGYAYAYAAGSALSEARAWNSPADITGVADGALITGRTVPDRASTPENDVLVPDNGASRPPKYHAALAVANNQPALGFNVDAYRDARLFGPRLATGGTFTVALAVYLTSNGGPLYQLTPGFGVTGYRLKLQADGSVNNNGTTLSPSAALPLSAVSIILLEVDSGVAIKTAVNGTERLNAPVGVVGWADFAAEWIFIADDLTNGTGYLLAHAFWNRKLTAAETLSLGQQWAAQFGGTYTPTNAAPGLCGAFTTPAGPDHTETLHPGDTLAWGAATDSDGDLDHYEVQWREWGGGISWNALGTPATNSYVLTAADIVAMGAGPNRYWRVRGIDATGLAGPWRESAKVTIDDSGAVAPGAPTISGAATGPLEVTLTLGAGSGATSHELRRDGVVIDTFGAVPTTPYVDAVPAPAGSYVYELRAINDVGSTSASVTVPYLPAAPTLTLAAASSTQLRATIGAGANATAHKLYAGDAAGFPRDPAHLVQTWGATPTSPYTFGAYGSQTTHYAVVVAENAFGSTESPERSATTLFGGPPPGDYPSANDSAVFARRWTDTEGYWGNWTPSAPGPCGMLGPIKGGFRFVGSAMALAFVAAPAADAMSVAGWGALGELNGALPFEPYAGHQDAAFGIGACISGKASDGSPQYGVAAVLSSGLLSGSVGGYPCADYGRGSGYFDVLIRVPGGGVHLSAGLVGTIDATVDRTFGCRGLRCLPKYDFTLQVTPRWDLDASGRTYEIHATVFGDPQDNIVGDVHEIVALPNRIPCGHGAYILGPIPGGFATFGGLSVDNTGSTCPEEFVEPATHTIETPTADTAQRCGELTLLGSPYAHTGAGNHVETDWIIRPAGGGASVWESLGGEDLERKVLPAGTVPYGTPLELVIVYRDDTAPTPIESSPSDPAPFTLDAPTTLGAPPIVSPVADEAIVGTGTLEFGAAPGAGVSETVVYGARITTNGGATWTDLFPVGSIVPDTPYTFDVSALPAGTAAIEVYAQGACSNSPGAVVCVTLAPEPCDPVPVNPTTLRRLELHSDTPFAGGRRTWFLPDFLEGGTDEREDQGVEHTVIPYLRGADGFPQLRGKAVLRLVWEDLTWDERRLQMISDGREDNGALQAELAADGMLTDLGRTLVKQQLYITGPDGVQRPGETKLQFGVYRRTALEHLTFLLQQSGAFPYFTVGDVLDTDAVIDLDFDYDTHLSALYKLCEAAKARVTYQRTCNGYRVNLVSQPSLPNRPTS